MDLLVKLFVLLWLAVFLFLAGYYWDIMSYFSPDAIDRWLTASGALAPIVYMVIMALAVVVSPIPSLPLDIAAGVFLGPFLGTLYSAVGALAGAVASFLMARILGRDLVEKILMGHVNFCTVCSDRILTKIVFLSRLLPMISFDVVNYGAGLTKMYLSRFSIATFLGMLPLTFVYNYFGSVLTFNKGWTLALGFLMVVFFFALPRFIEKRKLFPFNHEIAE